MSTPESPILIIGTGPAGLGAADRAQELGLSYDLIEASSLPFGHCKSFTLSADPTVVFDEGPHISFTKNEKVQQVFAESAPDFQTLQPKMKNYWQASVIDHPVQNNLFQVPTEARNLILADLPKRPDRPTKNYQDWLENAFGEVFTELFHERYTLKYWTRASRELTTDWVAQRIYRPTLDEMIQTATNPSTESKHYFSHFRYPATGGFQSFLRSSLARHQGRIQMGQAVTGIDAAAKKINLADGQTQSYSALVSSMPLNKIPSIIKNCPLEIQTAATKLHVTSVTLYSIIYRATNPPPSHWLYVYDQELPFARIYFPKALNDNFADPTQALQVEVYSSPFRPSHSDFDSLEKVIPALEKMNLLKAQDIIQSDRRHIPYANVIFDHDREPARKTILEYLTFCGIESAGRFGQWAYLWSDESYLSGQNAVDEFYARSIQKGTL